MADCTSPVSGSGPLGDGEFVVSEGDCIESIAFNLGYDWNTIWNAQENAALKEARKSPNILLPGDRLFIRPKAEKAVDAATDKLHRFIRKGTLTKLRVCVKRVWEPQKNQPYRLDVDGKIFTGTTDGDGWIEVDIPANAQTAKLTVGENPCFQQEFTLELGGMDPLTETVGIQKRLSNLGYLCEASGEMDDATRGAIAMFQAHEELEPTGEADEATIDRLKLQHGS